MQLHRTEYKRNLSVLWLFLATLVVTWAVCQCGPCTHILNTGRIHRFFSVLISQTNTKLSVPPISGFVTIEGNWLFPSDTHSSYNPTVCLYNSPFSTLPLKYSLTIPSPTQCTSLTTYININNAHYFLKIASEISAMNCQGHPSIWNRDTAENVQCCSGTVPLIIDISIPNIQRL